MDHTDKITVDRSVYDALVIRSKELNAQNKKLKDEIFKLSGRVVDEITLGEAVEKIRRREIERLSVRACNVIENALRDAKPATPITQVPWREVRNCGETTMREILEEFTPPASGD